MKNVTLAMDEGLLTKARDLASQRKTSLNALIRSLVEHEVEQADRIAWAKVGMKQLMADARAKAALDDGKPYVWDRRDAYGEREDRMLSRHERSHLRSFREES